MSEVTIDNRIASFLSRKEAEFPELHLEDRPMRTTKY